MAKNSRTVNLIGRILFVVYLILALYFMFFSESLDRTMVSNQYRYNLNFGTEIKRFWDMRHKYGWSIPLINLLGNGVSVTILAMVFSVLIETAQLIARVGAFDVDDILLNTLGGVVGYIFFVIGRKIVKGKNKR